MKFGMRKVWASTTTTLQLAGEAKTDNFCTPADPLVRGDVVDPVELCNLLRPGVVEPGGEHDLPEVNIKGVAPDGQPPGTNTLLVSSPSVELREGK